MIKPRFLLLILSAVFVSGCSMLSKINEKSNRKFVVNAQWVQDTLVKKNNEFRKINRMSPVIYKNTVVVGNSIDGLVSYDLGTKNVKWRLNIPYGVEASAASIKDRLFVGSNNGRMYSVNLQNGEIVWSFDSKSELVSEPLLNEGVLYFVSGSQTLYALDAATGKQLWIHSRQDTTSSMTIRGGSKPSIANDVLYVGFSDGALVALNAKTGTEQWEITLNRNSKFKDIDASPVIDGDFIYVNSFDDKVYCLSREKGEIVWNAPYGGPTTPLVSGAHVFVTSSKGELVSLSKKDGNLAWSRKTSEGIFSELSLFNDLIVTGETQGKLLFFNKTTGETVGSFEPGRGVFSKPSVFDNLIYFVSGEGNVYGLKAQYEFKSSIYYLN